MNTVIKPSIGRVVWFFANEATAKLQGLHIGDPLQACAAIITYVHSDTMVNLSVFDQNGKQQPVTSVDLLQDAENGAGYGMYATWMPYQKGQAAKTESLERQVLSGSDPAESAGKASCAGKGPRITPADIEANITSEHYFTAYGGAKYGRITRDEPADNGALKLLTFCVLVLRNGFTVTGESACVAPENFDADKGREVAREKAIDQVWPLMGYALKERLHNGEINRAQ